MIVLTMSEAVAMNYSYTYNLLPVSANISFHRLRLNIFLEGTLECLASYSGISLECTLCSCAERGCIVADIVLL